jgi:hypothetical protein
MRSALLLTIALLLGSCSQAVILIVENRSGAPITVLSRDAAGDHRYMIAANRVQKVEWPAPEHRLTIIASGCARSFDLDEYYDFSHDWREADSRVSRHYAAMPGGGLRIVPPDASHAAYTNTGKATAQRRNLTPSPGPCS